jgi:hypothetical protein
MTRRSFLSKAAIAAAVVVAGGIVKWRYFSPRNPTRAFPLMLSGFCDEATLREVGRTYLAQVPGEGSTKILLSRLAADRARCDADGPDGNEAAGEASLVEQDFRTKKILLIDGWIISETEARQCALLALS